MATKYKYNEKRKEWGTRVYDGTTDINGLPHRKYIYSKKSSKDLERKVEEFRRSLENKDLSLATCSFGEYALKWLDLYKSGKELNTYKMYSAAVKKLEPLFDIKLTSITRSHIQRVINDNSDKPKTCKNIKQTFTQILKASYIDGIIGRTAFENATTDISLPKYLKPVKSALTPLEREALLNCDLSDKARVLVSILYYCGLRKSEALALTRDDVDFENNTINVSKTLVYISNVPTVKPYPKSENGIRKVPMHPRLKEILSQYSYENTLFPSKNNIYMTDTAYRRLWANICKAMSIYAGEEIKITAHKLRHNFCSMMCYQVPTISTKKIAQIMGDTEKIVLNVYTHILEENENVEKALENAFS